MRGRPHRGSRRRSCHICRYRRAHNGLHKRQVDENTQLLGAVWDLEHAQAISRDQQTRQLFKSTADAAKIQKDVTESILFLEYNKRPVAQLSSYPCLP